MRLGRPPGADFDALFTAQFPVLVRTLRFVGHDAAVAEELAQDAFVQLYRHWAKVSTYDRPDLWIRTVALRAAVRARRRRLGVVEREQSGAAREATTAMPPDVDGRIDVLRALEQLTDRQRTVVALFYYEDRPMGEIATILDCSESSAWSHLSAARHRLSELLETEGAGDHGDRR